MRKKLERRIRRKVHLVSNFLLASPDCMIISRSLNYGRKVFFKFPHASMIGAVFVEKRAYEMFLN